MDFIWDDHHATIGRNNILTITKLFHFINDFENKYIGDPNMMPRELQSSDIVPVRWCPCQSRILPFVYIPGL